MLSHELTLPHICTQAILTWIDQTLASLMNFLFPQNPQNGATPHSWNSQQNEYVFPWCKYF
jgi:hypothetical protein